MMRRGIRQLLELEDDFLIVGEANNGEEALSLSYDVSQTWSVYFEASNLLDEPLELYQGNASRTLQLEEYGRSYALGLRVNL
mgnify:CR=1 FL=1